MGDEPLKPRASYRERIASYRALHPRPLPPPPPPPPEPAPPDLSGPPILWEDFERYARDNLKIVDKDSNLVPFILNSTQKRLLNRIIDLVRQGIPPRVICLKSRQVGVSSLAEGMFFYACHERPNRSALVIAHNEKSTKTLFRITHRFFRNLPDRMRQTTRLKSVREIQFANESHIQVETVGDVRGYTAQFCHASELAFWGEQAPEAFVAIMQAVPRTLDSLVIIESCVTGDTLVPTSRGLVPIAELVPNRRRLGHQPIRLRVATRDGFRPASSAYVNGKAVTTRIKTLYGFEVEATRPHPLLTLKDGRLEWKSAGEVEPGDWLCIAPGTSAFGSDTLDFVPTAKRGTTGNRDRFAPKTMTTDLAYLVGLYLAEGNASRKPVRTIISSGDDEIHERLASTWGFQRKDRFHSWWFRRDFVDFLTWMGCDITAHAPRKIIPARAMRLSRESQVALIQGMFDGDGTIHRNRAVVSYTTTSGTMCRQLQLMLLNLGVVSRRYRKPPSSSTIRGRAVYGRHDAHTLEIGGRYYTRFMDEIGFGLARKQALRSSVETKPHAIPGMWNRLRELVGHGYGARRKMLKAAGMGDGHTESYYGNRAMSLDLFNQFLASGVQFDPEIGRYFYDRVVSVVAGEAETFDLTVPSNQSFVTNGIISHNTANGVGDKFHQIWQRACAPHMQIKHPAERGWSPVFVPWFDHEEYQTTPWFGANEVTPEERELYERYPGKVTMRRIAWRRVCIDSNLDGDEEKFDREYPESPSAAFLLSGRKVFDRKGLTYYLSRIPPAVDINTLPKPCEIEWDEAEKKPQLLEMPNGRLRIYRQPQERHTYVLGADPSEGDPGSDPSPLAVLDQQNLSLVALWYGRMPPDELGRTAVYLARYFNDALIINEANNHGIAFHNAVMDLEYPNLYYRRTTPESVAETFTLKPGFMTTSKTRHGPINSFRRFVRDKVRFHLDDATRLLPDPTLIGEMETFVYKQRPGQTQAKAEAEGTSKDDCVMAFALALWAHRGSLQAPLEPIPAAEISAHADAYYRLKERDPEGARQFPLDILHMTAEDFEVALDAEQLRERARARNGLSRMA